MDELTSGILKAVNNQTGNHFDTYLLIADGDGRTLLSGAISQEDLCYLLYQTAKQIPEIKTAMMAALATLAGEEYGTN